MNEKTKNKLKNIFYDVNEEIIAILGQGFVTNFLFSGNISKTILILTNKRLYREGKAYAPSVMGKAKVSSVVNVEDVRATHFLDITHKGVVIFGAIIFLIGIVIGVAADGRHQGDIIITGTFLSIIGIIFYFIGLLSKKRLFLIEYVGGQIMVDCKWYPELELREFQKAINKIREEERQR